MNGSLSVRDRGVLVAFECLAYQLCRLFPDSEISVLRLAAYPFPVVMSSNPEWALRIYTRQHIPICVRPDYRELSAPEFSAADYRSGTSGR